jgi:hypothetical protein
MILQQQEQQQKIVNHNSLVQKNYAVSIFLKVNGEKASRIGIIGKKVEEEEIYSVISFAKRRRISEEIYFIICQSCFWCASHIGTNTSAFTPAARRRGEDAIPTKCPICIEGNIESMLLAKNEGYKFDYDRNRGVILEFLK